VIRISETLALLPAGRPVADPMAGLSSARMKRVVDEAAARFDWVILDTPPVGALADAAVLSGMVGGSILVVRAGVTPFDAVESAVAALGRDHVIGSSSTRWTPRTSTPGATTTTTTAIPTAMRPATSGPPADRTPRQMTPWRDSTWGCGLDGPCFSKASVVKCRTLLRGSCSARASARASGAPSNP